MSSSDLYDHPALYDALLPVRAHVPYHVELAHQTSGDVLELAYGTGQLTVPVATAGLPKVGIDTSAPMLDTAKKRAAAAKVSVEFLLGDMRNFDLGRQFGLVFIARNSLLHLHSTEDISAVFATVKRHLAPKCPDARKAARLPFFGHASGNRIVRYAYTQRPSIWTNLHSLTVVVPNCGGNKRLRLCYAGEPRSLVRVGSREI